MRVLGLRVASLVPVAQSDVVRRNPRLASDKKTIDYGFIDAPPLITEKEASELAGERREPLEVGVVQSRLSTGHWQASKKMAANSPPFEQPPQQLDQPEHKLQQQDQGQQQQQQQQQGDSASNKSQDSGIDSIEKPGKWMRLPEQNLEDKVNLKRSDRRHPVCYPTA